MSVPAILIRLYVMFLEGVSMRYCGSCPMNLLKLEETIWIEFRD